MTESAAEIDILGGAEHELLSGPGREVHAVHFYESELHLVELVARFVATGLESGEPVLVVASAHHAAELLGHLAREGFEIEASRRSGQLQLLDARATLGQILVDGQPDAERFCRVVGGAVARAAGLRGDARPRVYGEMVDLLTEDGNEDGAIVLEQLWNGLRGRHSISLLCAYQLDRFREDRDLPAFQRVCQEHSHVLPTERFLRLEGETLRLREIAVLQQRARALHDEIRRRERVEQQLRTALRVRDDFLSVAGHELRTPLTPLLLRVQALEREALSHPDLPLTTRVRRFTSSASQQLLRMSNMVSDLLDVSRITAGRLTVELRELDLAEIVREVCARFESHALRQGSLLRIETPAQLAGWTDRIRLEQVVTNLVDNALKYGAGKPVAITLEERPPLAVLSVSDEGIGIAREDLGRIFQRFERTAESKSFGGLGLGLYISSEVVKVLGGNLSVVSERGSGSTFTAELPLQRPREELGG